MGLKRAFKKVARAVSSPARQIVRKVTAPVIRKVTAPVRHPLERLGNTLSGGPARKAAASAQAQQAVYMERAEARQEEQAQRVNQERESVQRDESDRIRASRRRGRGRRSLLYNDESGVGGAAPLRRTTG